MPYESNSVKENLGFYENHDEVEIQEYRIGTV